MGLSLKRINHNYRTQIKLIDLSLSIFQTRHDNLVSLMNSFSGIRLNQFIYDIATKTLHELVKNKLHLITDFLTNFNSVIRVLGLPQLPNKPAYQKINEAYL
ncbi:hypothetical protein L21SP5_02172 [Salinivirga cyanobacteriivorans]|uniref:Uncharacterized protein n=1 Tax=Salinivirga cyanobacteriivorans TaxID=1307839 RepID=A0A0S2I0J6_9BACT|nr:hypothetical protein L21SP5_02172 [Salinivirga cyanobacteriivorans]